MTSITCISISPVYSRSEILLRRFVFNPGIVSILWVLKFLQLFRDKNYPIGADRQKTVHRIYCCNRCVPNIQLYTPWFATLVSGSRWTSKLKLRMVLRWGHLYIQIWEYESWIFCTNFVLWDRKFLTSESKALKSALMPIPESVLSCWEGGQCPLGTGSFKLN